MWKHQPLIKDCYSSDIAKRLQNHHTITDHTSGRKEHGNMSEEELSRRQRVQQIISIVLKTLSYL